MKIVRLMLTEKGCEEVGALCAEETLANPNGVKVEWGSTSHYGLESEPLLVGSPAWEGLMVDKVLASLFAHFDLTADYVVGRTTAPASYDGFGTLDLGPCEKPEYAHSDKPWRKVAILKQHLGWQGTRYHSGMCGFEELPTP